MRILRIIFWPLIMLKNILDPNWWAEHVGEKSGAYDKARNSKLKAWADSLEGWKWWAWQLGPGLIIIILIELGINQIGLTMLPW
jgi:hypothetical protein